MLHPCPHPPCPDCGADDALALRATYHYHPPLPLRWLAPFFPRHLTLIYTCAACHHRVLLPTIRPRSFSLLPCHAPRLTPPGPRRPHRRTRQFPRLIRPWLLPVYNRRPREEERAPRETGVHTVSSSVSTP